MDALEFFRTASALEKNVSINTRLRCWHASVGVRKITFAVPGPQRVPQASAKFGTVVPDHDRQSSGRTPRAERSTFRKSFWPSFAMAGVVCSTVEVKTLSISTECGVSSLPARLTAWPSMCTKYEASASEPCSSPPGLTILLHRAGTN